VVQQARNLCLHLRAAPRLQCIAERNQGCRVLHPSHHSSIRSVRSGLVSSSVPASTHSSLHNNTLLRCWLLADNLSTCTHQKLHLSSTMLLLSHSQQTFFHVPAQNIEPSAMLSLPFTTFFLLSRKSREPTTDKELERCNLLALTVMDHMAIWEPGRNATRVVVTRGVTRTAVRVR
jgi:hypothetical protein